MPRLSTGTAEGGYLTERYRFGASATSAPAGLTRSTLFVSDTFTGTNGDALPSTHVGETGATWTVHGSYGGIPFVVASNKGRVNDTGTSMVYASGTPAGTNYEVEAVLSEVTATASTLGLCARVDTAANTFYHVRWDEGNARWELFKFVAGAATSLGTYVGGDPTTPRTVILRMTDAAKEVYIDGVLQITSADNAITANGRVGMRGSPSSISTGFRLDDFKAYDLV